MTKISKVDQVRALFVPGKKVECVANTYYRDKFGDEAKALRTWTVKTVGKSVWESAESGWRGTFPTRVRDVVSVNETEATWLIGRGDHTVTYRKVV